MEALLEVFETGDVARLAGRSVDWVRAQVMTGQIQPLARTVRGRFVFDADRARQDVERLIHERRRTRN